MGGPSLRQLHAHHAIHQGGLTGALDKTREVEELLEAKEFKVARQAADHLIEYWETRILSHADAEEEGFYQEKVEKKPELQEAVVKLTRDHDLLRIIVKSSKPGSVKKGLRLKFFSSSTRFWLSMLFIVGKKNVCCLRNRHDQDVA